MNITYLTLPAIFLFSGIANAEQTAAEQAIAAVKELCLAGSQYDLKADAKGNLSFSKLLPGAFGNVSVNARSSPGAAAIFDDKVRRLADSDIRDCIKPHIPKIIDAILSGGAPLSTQQKDVLRAPSKSTPKPNTQSKLDSSTSSSAAPAASRDRQSNDEKLIDELQPSLSFVVGGDALSSDSIVSLRLLALKLLPHKAVVIKLIPYASRDLRDTPLSPASMALALKRQAKVRDFLMQAGLPSTQIVFVRNQVYGNTTDEVFDNEGHQLEKGLSVELSQNDA